MFASSQFFFVTNLIFSCPLCGDAHRARDCLGPSAPGNRRRSEISSFAAKRDVWRDFDEADFAQVAAEFESKEEISGSEISPEMRTLRSRVDVAAYLRKDLVGNYNPKSRAVISDSSFVKADADVVSRLRNVASEIGNFVDVANPTEAEILFRVVEQRKTKTAQDRKRHLADIYEIRHSEIFGSFFDIKTGKWGFACCRSIDPSTPTCKK